MHSKLQWKFKHASCLSIARLFSLAARPAFGAFRDLLLLCSPCIVHCILIFYKIVWQFTKIDCTKAQNYRKKVLYEMKNRKKFKNKDENGNSTFAERNIICPKFSDFHFLPSVCSNPYQHLSFIWPSIISEWQQCMWLWTMDERVTQ